MIRELNKRPGPEWAGGAIVEKIMKTETLFSKGQQALPLIYKLTEILHVSNLLPSLLQVVVTLIRRSQWPPQWSKT
jgi:hypothetical protein